MTESIDKILSKLGIYDIIAVFFTGSMILVISQYILRSSGILNIDIGDLSTDNVYVFIVFSYFTGLVFQEIGSVLARNIIYKDDRLLEIIFTQEDSCKSISGEQINKKIRNIPSEENIAPTNYKEIYDYCKKKYKKETTRLDRDQSIAAMARSLSLYFCLVFVFSIVLFINNLVELNAVNYSFTILRNIGSDVLLFFTFYICDGNFISPLQKIYCHEI